MRRQWFIFLLFTCCFPLELWSQELDENCTVNILNRIVQVSVDGSWSMPNVPSFMGRVRARATCVVDGVTAAGQSDFFSVESNNTINVSEIVFEDATPIPVSLAFWGGGVVYLDTQISSLQLDTFATYSDDSISNTLTSSDGINFISSNPNIVSVDADGLLTAVNSGSAVVTARLEGVIALKQVNVSLSGDMDGDGLPDDYENANGLNPNDPVDAFEDQDNDGLTALEEFEAGTDVNLEDTDNDGVNDGEELIEGLDGFVTNPLLADSDGDGFFDGLEISLATDPTDDTSFDIENALESISIQPDELTLIFNGVDTEVSDQISVIGDLIDGNQLDITSSVYGTNYASSDLAIANFGLEDGQIFGSAPGEATITVTNSGYSDSIAVTVTRFDPVALSAMSIPGYANNVDIQGDYTYVAAGSAGLVIVDVTDRTAPTIVGEFNTAGIAIDVKVSDTTVYLADGLAGVHMIDVTDVTDPQLISTYDTGGVARDLAVDLQFIYVADDDGGLDIINITDPEAPFSVSTMNELGSLVSVDIDQGRLVAASDSTMHIIDITDPNLPVLLSSVNVGQIKSAIINDNHVYLAVYSNGYKVFNITESTAPVEVGSDRVIVPRDLVLSGDFLMFAEQLFPNVVAYVNVADPDNAVFQGVIDLSPFGDYAGTGIAADSHYVYVTEESFAVGSDYKAQGDTRLFIAQHRQQFDSLGIAPTVTMTQPLANEVMVEGVQQIVSVDAVDDIAVKAVEFVVDGQVVFTDNVAPYQMLLPIPLGATNITVSANAIDLGDNTSSTPILEFAVEPDTDEDGLGDSEEVDTYNTFPDNPDSDADGLLDGREAQLGTNPLAEDSDDDGVSDADEISNGTDPLNPDITPPTVVAVSPVSDATDIAESTLIKIDFNEPLLKRSIGSSDVTVSAVDTGIVTDVDGRLTLVGNGYALLFEPNDLLSDYTEYQVRVTDVKDSAGNLISEPFVSTFTTGNTVDIEAPYVDRISPIDGSENVPVNAIVSIQLNERIDESSFSNDDIYIFDTDTNTRVAATATLSEDLQLITITPNTSFPVGRNLYVYISQLRDLFNNQISTRQYYFTTAFEADVVSPQLLEMSIGDGYTDVPTNAVLEMQFDEPINSLSISSVNLFQGGNVVPLQSRTLSDANRRVRLQMPDLLEPNTEYVLRAEGVEDTSGNVQSQAVEVTFITGDGSDLSNLSVNRFVPLANQTNVPTNTRLVLQYNQRLNPLKMANFTLVATSNDRVRLPLDVVLEQPNTIVVTPRGGDLLPNTQYYLQNTANIESITGATRRIGFYFTTGDEAVIEPVMVTDWTMPEDYAAFPVNGTLIIDLSMPTDYLSCAIEESVAISDGVNELDYTWWLSNDRTRLELTPTDLVANSSYTVTIDGICDYAGNRLSVTRYDFNTGSGEDTTAPTLVSVSPVDEMTDVSVTSPVIWTFSEPVWFDDESLNDNVYLYLNDDSANKLSGDVSWNADHTVLTFTPSVPYPADTLIQAGTSYRTFYDLAGNRAGYSDNVSSRFSTAAGPADVGPVVTQVVPADGAVDIDRNNKITLTFSKPLDHRTLKYQTLGLYANGERIDDTSISRSYDNRTLVLSSDSVPAGSTISVIATDEVRDLLGNRLSDFVSLYSTAVAGETTRPSVNTVYPGNNANNVDVNKKVVLYVNEPVDGSTVTMETLRVSQEGVLVNGTLEVSGDAQVITFTPDQPWAAGSIIQVFAQSGILDLNGNALNSYQSLFRTQSDEDDETSALEVIATSHLDDLPTNARVRLMFNKPLNPLSVDTQSVTVYDLIQDAYVTPDVTLLDNDRVLELSMPSGWSPNVNDQNMRYIPHEIDLSGVQDIYGNSLNGYYDFYTANGAIEDTQSPSVIAMSPADGIEDVGINAQVHIRFDEAINPLTFTRGLEGMQLQSVSFASDNQSVTYIPHEPFAANSEITLDVPVVEDSAGNVLLTPYSVTFTTASGVDLTPPDHSMIVPSDDETVAVNAIVRVQFNEPVTPASINTSSIGVYDEVDRRYIELTLELSDDYRAVNIVPEAALAVGRSYLLEIRDIYDLAYNRASSDVVSHRFVTSFEEDVIAPELLGMSIRDGDIDVPTNAVLEMQFDEPLNTLSISSLNLLQGGNVVPLQSRTLRDANRQVRLQTANLLEPNTEYVLRAEGVEDISGNVQSQAVEITFTTGDGADLSNLTLNDHLPSAPQTNVPINTRLVFQYNQRLNPLEVANFTLIANDNSSVSLPLDVVLEQPDTIVLKPRDGDLLPNTRYYIYNTSDIESITGGTIKTNIYFTTGDQAAREPVVVTDWTMPEDYAAFPVNGTLIIDLSMPMDDLSCAVEDSVTISDGVNTLEYTWSLKNSRTRLELTPTDLVANSSYTVTIDGMCDYAGNSLPATRYDFSTGSDEDTTAPTLVSVSPADNATGVSVTSPVIWTFSEPVWFDNDSLNDNVYLYIRDDISVNKLSGDISWNADHTVLTFTPSVPYPADALIQTAVSSSLSRSLFRDLAGNRAGNNNFSPRFTTATGPAEAGPVVTQVVPADGAVDIDRNNQITLTFSKPLDYRTLDSQALGLYANGSRISISISRSYDNRTLVLSPSSVPAGSTIAVIATDEVRDLLGNRLSDFVSLYSTAVASETTRPSVNTVYPGDNANNVDVNKKVVLYVNEPIDASTVTMETLRVSQEGVLVTGTLEVSGDAQVITFTPDQPWAAGSTIQVFAQSGILDLNGNALNSYQSLFRIQGDDDDATSALEVIATSHLDDLPTNARVGLRFNKPLNPLSVDNESVIVYDLVQDAYVTPDVTLLDNDRVLELSMPSGWSPNVNDQNMRYVPHEIALSGVQDIYGNSINYQYYDFYTANGATEDTLSPSVTAMSPIDGMDDVGINAQVHIRFDEAINPLTFTRELEGTQLQSVSFSGSNQAVTYTAHEPFAASSEITLDAPAVEDSAGNVLTPHSVTFTTASGVDLTPPDQSTIIVMPGSRETVAVNAILRIQFNEPVTPTSINTNSIQVYDEVDSRFIELTRELSDDYLTVNIVPETALVQGRSYRLEIRDIYDMAYNRTSSWLVYNDFTASFEEDTTAPEVLDMSIRDGDTDVPTNAILEMQFDEPISRLSLSSLNLLQGENVIPLQGRTLSDGARRVRLQVANLLEPNTEYVLRAEGVENTSGNVQSEAVEITFTTGDGPDLSDLTLSRSTPSIGEGNIPTNTRLVFKYNQQLNPLEINSFGLNATNNSSVRVLLDVVLEEPDTIVVTPSAGDLLPNTQYSVYNIANIVSITGATTRIGFLFTTGDGVLDLQ